MTGLLTSLQSVSNALSAFSQALGAEQSNVSNSSTPGYAAVRAVIQPVGFEGSGGSDSIVLQSTGSAQADAIVQATSSQASDSQTQAQQLSLVNQQFDITGSTGILAAFQQFSTAFAALSVTPDDSSLAATAIAAAGNVANAFNSVAQSLSSQSQSLQTSAQSTVSQINDLAGQIAQYNVELRGQTALNPALNPAVDASRRSALTQLSSLVGITVTGNADGTVNVLAGETIPLVLGDQSYSLTANLTGAPGSQITSSGGGSTPASFSGTLGGLVDTFNNTIASIIGGNGQPGSLNTLAQGFASTVNSLLTSGVSADGSAGVPIFTYDTTNAANVASTLAVDSAVTASQLAVGTTGVSAQSNGVANQLAGLAGSNKPADQIDGQAPQDYYASIAQSVGRQLSDASSQATTDQASLTSARANQTAVEGVSLDQEAVNITAYQRAWEASAKLITVLDNLALDSVNLVGEQDA